MNNVYEKMKELGIQLNQPVAPIGLYKTAHIIGDMVYTSGTGATVNGKHLYLGKVGKEVSKEEAKEAARLTMLNILANVEQAVGDLNRIQRVVKILGFVASADGFYEHPAVINGASQVLIDIWGEDLGKGSRSAVGVYSLPEDIPVEIEAVFQLKNEKSNEK